MPISAPPPSWASIKNKPTTVAGFGITDMASQSVNYANSSNNATNVTNVTAAQVANATAGISAGAVGSYAWTRSATVVSFGATKAGSGMTPAMSGTWRNTGTIMYDTNTAEYYTGFLRIS